MKLIKGNYYKVKGFDNLLLYTGLSAGDYDCDLCNKNHYNKGKLPLLHWFEVNKDNYAKFGTSCINKVLQ